jgi:biopolymer transport protein ExbD
MAELQTNNSKKGNKKINKKSTRVDLTPMVDLGFLLLTFFVFTTTMSLPRTMHINVPKGDDRDSKVCESCALTVLLDKDNIIRYYEGDLANHPPVKETTFSPDGIRKALLEKRKLVKATRGNVDEMTLIIKPSDGSNLQNFVDMMDEVAINNIKLYYVDELSVEDKKLLKSQN